MAEAKNRHIIITFFISRVYTHKKYNRERLQDEVFSPPG